MIFSHPYHNDKIGSIGNFQNFTSSTGYQAKCDKSTLRLIYVYFIIFTLKKIWTFILFEVNCEKSEMNFSLAITSALLMSE